MFAYNGSMHNREKKLDEKLSSESGPVDYNWSCSYYSSVFSWDLLGGVGKEELGALSTVDFLIRCIHDNFDVA